MLKAYILVGVPGAGKSTWVQNQKWASECSYISTDQWVDLEAERTGKTYSEVFADYMPKAVDLMLRKVELAKEANMHIIWDQTSTSVNTRAKKIRMLPGYNKIAVVFRTPPLEELMRRIDSRVGKDVPAKVILDMIEKWEEPTHEEGFNEIWYAQ